LPDEEIGSILAANAANYTGFAVLPTHKYLSVNNLGFDSYHGTEEVGSSIKP
jgi:hypothetical protein